MGGSRGTGRAVVIGAGAGGLAAAARLARAGWAVTLLEKTAHPGGKMGRYTWTDPQRGPFTWDTGPSLITMPFVLERLFADLGRPLVRDAAGWSGPLGLEPVEPLARYCFADGPVLDTTADLVELRRRVRATLGSSAEQGLFAVLERGRTIWEAGGKSFLDDTPERAVPAIMRAQLTAAGGAVQRLREGLAMLRAMAPWASLADVIAADAREPHIRDLLIQYATYSGASPWRAPALLSVIPYVEFFFGGWYVRGGLFALSTALLAAARELGVAVRFNAPVERILFTGAGRERRASGVRLAGGEVVPADVVVTNADAVYTLARLIAPADRPHFSDRRVREVEPSGSGCVFLWAVDRDYPLLAHHTKFMPADYARDLRAMFDRRCLGDEPAVYVGATCRADADHAAPGCLNLFVLASAPYLDGRIDWRDPAVIADYRRRILAVLARRPEWGLGDLERHIVHERVIHPLGFEQDLNAWRGSIYGLSGNGLRQSLLRPPVRYPAARGLYFVGGASHPGGGVPLVLLSAEIAARRIAGDLPL